MEDYSLSEGEELNMQSDSCMEVKRESFQSDIEEASIKEGNWGFPTNGYATECGLDTSDMETFKKDPIASLAREICQNSIDARCKDVSHPVIVSFKSFEMDREDIPGIEELTEQINRCYEFKKDSRQEGKALAGIKRNIEKKKLTCIRISDFSTSGLLGVQGKDTPFHKLTKGSGVSEKQGTSGGSKGIGKFAAFVVSSTNTVFYSTKTINGEEGCIGIAKLRSVPVDTDNELMTMGIGYYSKGEKHRPLNCQINLDKKFSRTKDTYGTDVFIIGYEETKGWENDIIAKVLDSFMVAIMRDELIVEVNDIVVSFNKVKEIIEDETFKKERGVREYRGIRAQYDLLTEEGVESRTINISGSDVHVFVKAYSAKEESKATKQCVMIRYPYMKIRHMSNTAFLPYSAICIIDDNDLNGRLRDIENPQHTDWEIKRLNDYPDEKKITGDLKKKLEEEVQTYIEEVLSQGAGTTSDIEGAGVFLPSQDDCGMESGNNDAEKKVKIAPAHKVIVQTPKTVKAGDDGEGFEFGRGDDGDEDEFKKVKKKKNKAKPNPQPKPEPKDDDIENKLSGGNNTPVLKKVPLSGMRFKNIVRDKKEGIYDLMFTSLYDEQECEFVVRMCGETSDKYPVTIVKAEINGEECTVSEGKVIGFKLSKGFQYKISYQVNMNVMFASEVVLNAYR